MREFFSIAAASAIASAFWGLATFSLRIPDPAFYISLENSILLLLLVSEITALIFFGFFRFFGVRNKNQFAVGTAAFMNQLTIFILPLAFNDSWNGIAFLVAIPASSAITNYMLDKIYGDNNGL